MMSLSNDDDSTTTPAEGFDKLSDQMLLEILSYVPHDDFLNIRLVNHRFHRLSHDPSLWRTVDLVRPRTPQQISALATTMFQSIGGRIRELKITGFYDMLDFLDDNEPMSCTVLEKIKATCHQLRTFIIRKCRFDWEPNFHDHLPSTLHKLEFHYCRLPNLPSSWMEEMTAAGGRVLLENLVTLKFHSSTLDMQFVRYLRARQSLRNLSLLNSTARVFVRDLYPDVYMPSAPFPRLSENLKFLDLSGTEDAVTMFVHEWVHDNVQCNVTHLFMERPNSFGRPYGEHTFKDIHSWAALSTMKHINASGCDLTQKQRDKLVRRHPTVVFNLNEYYDESPRVEF